jgi:RNA methyltransferase, TrmH family
MITSVHNPRVQQVRALLGRRKERDEAHAFVVEGVRLVEEALSTGAKPRLVLFTGQLSERGRALLPRFSERGCEVEEIAPHVMESVAGTEAPQGILAVLPYPDIPLPPALDFVLVVDNLRDPGNLGAILRTAAAAGVQAAILTPGTTDPFAPKVVRAGMGAHFRLPVLSLDWMDIRSRFKTEKSFKFYLAEAGAGSAPWDLDLRSPVGLVIGGEAEGAGESGRQFVDAPVSIPMPGGFESLNAAIAAGILIFEVVRQRAVQRTP